MTVDLCTKSCKEIGQPLAALNYGTVSQDSLIRLVKTDFSAHVAQNGMAESNYHPYPVVSLVPAIVPSDVEDGQDNPASIDPTRRQPITPQHSHKVISDVGRRPIPKLYKVSGSGSILRVSIAVVQSARPRGTLCQGYRMANVGPQ